MVAKDQTPLPDLEVLQPCTHFLNLQTEARPRFASAVSETNLVARTSNNPWQKLGFSHPVLYHQR